MPPNVSTLRARSARFPLPVRLPTPPHAAVRPGWLTSMVAQAQDQLHRGTAPELPVPPLTRRRRVIATVAPTPAPQETRIAVRAAPRLDQIAREDLIEINRLLELYAQAVQLRLIGGSEAARLTFVGLAQHVIVARPTNPGGLFRHLLYQKRYQCVTQADEDRALQRLKQYLYGRSVSDPGRQCCSVGVEGVCY